MADRYAPLVFLQNPCALPPDYLTKIPFVDNTQTITDQQYKDKMNNFFGLHEVETEDVMVTRHVNRMDSSHWKVDSLEQKLS